MVLFNVSCYNRDMEKLKGYVPQNNGAEFVPLRNFTKRDVAIVVFPSRGKPFAALLTGRKETSQEHNPSIQLWAEGGFVIFAGGTTACKLEDLEKFPLLKDKINTHTSEYRPRSYRYTEEAEARFMKKKLGQAPRPRSEK